MNKIAERVSELAHPVAEKHGCELWDVEYVKEAGGWFLRVYIDRPGGVSIDHCEAVSRELGDLLDEADPVPGSYTFEVSSPGAERPLRRPEDFQRYMGEAVSVRLYQARDGKKEFVGKLSGFDGGAVEIAAADRTVRFEKNEIALVRLRVEF